MGFVGRFCRIFCTVVVPVFILSFALLIGWFKQEVIPEGRFFATVIPMVKGKSPPSIVGHGKMEGTPPVPDDMMPEPRPENEMFVELPGGYKMPQNGIGMCCRPTAYDDVLVERTVLWYLLMGGRTIDTAHVYLNHEAIGRGIKEAIRRGVPRNEIFVTTKIYPAFFGYKNALKMIPLFLEELELEYLDLVIMHAPVRFPGFTFTSEECSEMKLSLKECRQETFKGMSEMRKQGLVRNVGVSNFASGPLLELLEVDGIAPIANNQIQYNPWSPQETLDTIAFCRENNISITAYNSLGGLQHEKVHTIEVLNSLSEKYQKRHSQLMLRWALQVGAAIIPGTGNPKHMRENLGIYSFEIAQEDMEALASLHTDGTANDFIVLKPFD